jgi:hypothetical protein
MSTPTNKEQMVQLEIFNNMEVATDLGDEQLLTDEQIGEPEANLNDSDSLLQPVVLCVQGNIEMHDETDETAILNELAPVHTETLPLDQEESHEEFHNIVNTLEPVKQRELNDNDDAANKDQKSNAAVQESESEQESESAEQEDESAEQEDESAEEEEQTNETNVEEVLSEQEDESAGGHEIEGEQDDIISDECEQQDQTEEDGSSDNAEEEAEKKDKEAESPSDGVDLNETVFFSPDSNRSDAEAIEATDDTDSFKSTE